LPLLLASSFFEAVHAQEHGKTEDWKSGPVAAEAEADLIKVHAGSCVPGHCGSSPTKDDVKELSPPGGASDKIGTP